MTHRILWKGKRRDVVNEVLCADLPDSPNVGNFFKSRILRNEGGI